jgi:uncharacterized membrane protein
MSLVQLSAEEIISFNEEKLNVENLAPRKEICHTCPNASTRVSIEDKTRLNRRVHRCHSEQNKICFGSILFCLQPLEEVAKILVVEKEKRMFGSPELKEDYPEF